jgi:metal-dependent hydrolase (beta-lactamase superfamily II)
VLVINTGDKLAVFETGMSSVKRTPLMGRLAANLKLACIDPTDIDAIIPMHAHVDHIGGIMAEDGSRNYPNAQILVQRNRLIRPEARTYAAAGRARRGHRRISA